MVGGKRSVPVGVRFREAHREAHGNVLWSKRERLTLLPLQTDSTLIPSRLSPCTWVGFSRRRRCPSSPAAPSQY